MSPSIDFTILIWSVIILFSAMALTIVIKEIYEYIIEKKGKKSKREVRFLKLKKENDNEQN
ncbi:MAG: hypothetical protein EAX96_19110 [Candidatus Lokiarchaeota archaeon]|nr:hypothetical protein [Candidatus Lokiarchaeota archaeon]